MNTTRGVVIVAIGHPFYGRMVFNLAKTIKAVDRTCPIQIICDGTALDHVSSRETWVFDHVTYTNDQNGFKIKLHVDELSVFDEFILMDADCAWVSNKSPIELIKALAIAHEFSAITEGMHNYDQPAASDYSKKYLFWADLAEMQQQYDLSGVMYQWRTEFMFVKKGELVSDLFGSARYVYAHAHALTSMKLFANHVPDELAINIAACVHGVHPHTYKWQPTFWHRIAGENGLQIEELQAKYYALSCGSNVTSSQAKRLYDRIVKAASGRLGLGHVFPMIDKRQMMPHRQLM